MIAPATARDVVRKLIEWHQKEEAEAMARAWSTWPDSGAGDPYERGRAAAHRKAIQLLEGK
jgi:hypothetical protein